MTDRTRKVVRVTLAIIAYAFVFAGVVTTMRAQGLSTSGCQYPARPLVDGHCDNSDPADPQATVKGESSEEIRTPVSSSPDVEVQLTPFEGK